MRCKVLKTLLGGRTLFSRPKKHNNKGLKLCLLGACGEMGQPLSLLLKTSAYLKELSLYDLCSTNGLAMELNMIDTTCQAKGHHGKSALEAALKDSHIIVMAAASKRNNFDENAVIVENLSRSCALHAPQAVLCLCTSPINSMLPIACETYKKAGQWVDPCKMIGVLTLDVVRASTYLSRVAQLHPEVVDLPVIGGSSSTTLVPLFSRAKPSVSLTRDQVSEVTDSVRKRNEEDLECSGVEGCRPGLSGAFAVNRMVNAVARALSGEHLVQESAYVMSNVIPGIDYLATQLELGTTGIVNNCGIPSDLSEYECFLMESALVQLKKDIYKGEEWTRQPSVH